MSNPAPGPSLARTASRGIAVTIGGVWGKTLVQMGSTVVLARLLAPADFGMIAMITAIVGVADLIRDFGMTGAIVQARHLGRAIWRSIYWFSVGAGAFFAVLIAACAPLIAALYGEPRLVELTWAIAPTLLLNGIAMPLQARATRELRFAALANIDVLSMAAGVAASIAAAMAGLGVWSLVALAVAQSASRLIMLWRLIRPQFGTPKIRREVLPLVTTGGSIFGAAMVGYAEKNMDNVVIGQQLGAETLGQYSRAFALFMLPIQQLAAPVGRVALPVLSRLRDDGERYRRYIRGSLLVTGYAIFPTYGIAAAVSHPLFRLLLGPGWDLAATLFSLLAIAGIVQAFANVRTWICISLERSHPQFVFDLCTRPIMILGYFVGVWWNGVVGLVIVYGILSIVLMIPAFAVAIRGTFVRPSDVLHPVIRPAIAAAAGFAGAMTASRLITSSTVVELLTGTSGGLLAVLLLMVLPAYRRDVRAIGSLFGQMRKA